MKLAIGADHAGFNMKWKLVNWLRTTGAGAHKILDVGTASEDSVDYPDFAHEVAKAVSKKRVSKGILLCGTGIGMSMAANKVSGVRAAVAWNPKVASLTAEHNAANVVCLPARFLTLAQAKSILRAFLSTPFAGGRHLRRVKKIDELDK